MNQTVFNFQSTYSSNFKYGNANGYSTPADICLNRTLAAECDTTEFAGLEIFEPELLPCCFVALILGLTLAKEVYRLKRPNYLMYAITFAMTGVMMTDAGWNDCILVNLWPNDHFAHLFWGVLDVGLTSSIGLAFLFDALLDAKILKNKRSTYVAYGIGVCLIFYAYVFCYVHKVAIGLVLLYMGIVGIGCGSWVIIQTILTILHEDWKSFWYLILAGLSGGFGFFSLVDFKLSLYLCEHFSCHVNTQFIWFLVTDISIYFIYLYYKTRTEFLMKYEQKPENVLVRPPCMEMVEQPIQERLISH